MRLYSAALSGAPFPRLLVVEDDPIVAEDIRATAAGAGYDVRAVVGAVDDAERALDEHCPDAVIVDIGLERGSGLSLGASLSRRNVPFLYLTGRSDAKTTRAAADTNPVGYVVKPFSQQQLLAAMIVGFEGGAADRARRLGAAVQRIAAEVVELGLASPSSRTEVRPVPGLTDLSRREWEVLRELLAHNRVPAIARKLFISQATVRNHLKAIFAKLGVHSQQELLQRLVS